MSIRGKRSVSRPCNECDPFFPPVACYPQTKQHKVPESNSFRALRPSVTSGLFISFSQPNRSSTSSLHGIDCMAPFFVTASDAAMSAY